MNFYFVGLAMRSRNHDYSPIHDALMSMQARRVSTRIWLCAVNRAKTDAFTHLYRHLAANDQLMVVEVPESMRLPQAVNAAAA